MPGNHRAGAAIRRASYMGDALSWHDSQDKRGRTRSKSPGWRTTWGRSRKARNGRAGGRT
eukprot:6653016-Pyramimonas_sp.AAC.1